jgi:hypothetical protein
LEKEYNNALSSNAYYDKLLNSQNFKLATPTKNKEVRPYNLFTLDDFIEAL